MYLLEISFFGRNCLSTRILLITKIPLIRLLYRNRTFGMLSHSSLWAKRSQTRSAFPTVSLLVSRILKQSTRLSCFPLKDNHIKGYSDALSAACVAPATAYLNHIVENFQRRVLYYLTVRLSMDYKLGFPYRLLSRVLPLLQQNLCLLWLL